MKGRQKRVYTAAGFALLFLCGIVLMLQISPSDVLQNTFEFFNRAVQRESLPARTSTPDAQATVAFERTAIARFTENPALALSSTPFYVEIIFSEMNRRRTETPGYSALPVVAMWTLEDEPQLFKTWLAQKGVEARVFIASTGLEGIDSQDQIPFQAVHSQFVVSRDVDDLQDASILPSAFIILDTIVERKGQMSNVSYNNMSVDINFYAGNRAKWLRTSLDNLMNAYEAKLSGNDLIAALGGFREGDVVGN